MSSDPSSVPALLAFKNLFLKYHQTGHCPCSYIVSMTGANRLIAYADPNNLVGIDNYYI